MGSTSGTLFEETQCFRQRWLWALLLAGLLVPLALLAFGAYGQLVRDQPWGGKPLSNGGLLAVAAGYGVMTAALMLLFWKAKLVTVVRDGGLFVRFSPFHWSFHRIDLRTVTRVEAVAYSPLGQYGGWGIRYGIKSKAYNVSGHWGVRLIMTNGRSLLIGSQRADELAAALQRVWTPAHAS